MRVESPVNAIVSVLMLREGWDVQNVTVIVGLRPYTSKANILPEQTIGRGLRLMFASLRAVLHRSASTSSVTRPSSSLSSSWRRTRTSPSTPSISKSRSSSRPSRPTRPRLDKDIDDPCAQPVLARKKTLAEEIAALDVMAMHVPDASRRRRTTQPPRQFHYEGYDIITLQKLSRAGLHHPRAADRRGGDLLLRQAHRTGREAAVAVRGARPQGPRVPGAQGVRRDCRSSATRP